MIPEIINPPSKVDPTQRNKGLDDKSKLKLQKAVKDFEAMFVNYLLQNMRKTVQKSGEDESGFGGDMMQGMFDLELSKHVAGAGSLGIGEMLYRQMTGESLPKHASTARSTVVHTPVVVTAPTVAKDVPERATNPLEKVLGDPPEHLNAVSRQSSANESRSALNGQSFEPSKPTPSPFTPSLNPPTASVSVPDHVRIARVAAESTATSLPQRLGQYDSYIRQASDTFDISPNLIRAVIAAESSGNARAVSSKSAKGVMQLIDSTANAMGVNDVWNPRENILGGSKYLKQMLDRFNGDVKLALASYNAGPAAVEKHGGVPPYNETRKYVERVMNYLQLLNQNGVLGNEER
jgi:Rod binding domain-containing protein